MFGLKPKRHFTREVAITPPTPEQGRHGIAIVSCIKNEATYIEEWVRFHKAVGVRHFHLYDDASTDSTLEVLHRILTTEELTIVPWKMRMRDEASGHFLNGQTLAFAHAILNFGSKYDRMAFIDVDEFLLPRKGRTLQEALRGAGEFPNISLPWHMFGHSGHVSKPEAPVCLSYTMRVSDPMRENLDASNFKCIVDPVEVTRVSVHHFETRSYGDTTVNDAGKKFAKRKRKIAEFYSSEFIQLNHYYAKSRQELTEKVERGWSFDGSAEKYRNKVSETIKYIEENVVEDRRMVEFIEQNGIHLGR
ncbi:glycosyltransferase family 92 protein [Sinorhizobium numidicum]|uniref:Glycosyltransferase family 92 protein n=1 Tax=Sinorhizobium numidicum TaxID=680248 RepID=A0ABY8CWU4_9HYPH|nr:glycosyltransferase family 92 protein [Sinorhizobium numidicum]WEX75772.1 glycosyltransferase family 92 protein [Sinorhizobium numidicum]WEX81208.1 glycosyltransferase family 92 protein [Sinorhizobium numidicum]